MPNVLDTNIMFHTVNIKQMSVQSMCVANSCLLETPKIYLEDLTRNW